jgi:hypothetical protein
MGLVRHNSYALLPVSLAAYNEIKRRLEEANELDQYIYPDELHGEVIHFGRVELVRDYEAHELLGKLVRFPQMQEPAGRVNRVVDEMVELDDSYMQLSGQFSPGGFVIVEEP